MTDDEMKEEQAKPVEPMTVQEAIDFLSEQPRDAHLLICAHGFKGMEGRAWMLTHFVPFVVDQDDPVILAEGAGDPALTQHEGGDQEKS